MRNQDWDPETFLTPEEDHHINVAIYWFLLFVLVSLLYVALDSVRLDKQHKEVLK